MGVEGAAYATLIANLSFLIPSKSDFRFNFKLAGDMYATGVSMGLMISLVGIGTVIMQGAINIFGTDIIVAHTTARKISEIYMLPISVFGAASATFSSQNYGAGRIDRVKKKATITWGVCYRNSRNMRTPYHR